MTTNGTIRNALEWLNAKMPSTKRACAIHIYNVP